jgi:hypothetical protein
LDLSADREECLDDHDRFSLTVFDQTAEVVAIDADGAHAVASWIEGPPEQQ